MKTPESITEAIEGLEKVGKYYLESLYPKDQVPKIERGGDLCEANDGGKYPDSDLHISIEGWIMITPFHTMEEYPCIGCKRTRPAIHYSIQREEICRGVYRRSDGSGEPDTVDIVDVATEKPLTNAFQAIEFVCKMLHQNEMDAIGERFSEDEWAAMEAAGEVEEY